nr:hypothetical protein [Solirubrobacterales bacterium]
MARRIELTEVTIASPRRPPQRRPAAAADAPPGTSKRPVSGSGLLFSRLARASGRALARALEPLGLRPPEFGVLHY